MKRLVMTAALVCATALLATTARGQTASWRAHENAHHALLRLELQEAMEHAKALHHYTHGNALGEARDVVARHVLEIGDNLDGIDAQIAQIQDIDGDGARFDFEVAEVHNHGGLARESLEALRAEAARPAADVRQLDCLSADIHDALRQAMAHDRRTMAKHRVPAPLEPTVDG